MSACVVIKSCDASCLFHSNIFFCLSYQIRCYTVVYAQFSKITPNVLLTPCLFTKMFLSKCCYMTEIYTNTQPVRISVPRLHTKANNRWNPNTIITPQINIQYLFSHFILPPVLMDERTKPPVLLIMFRFPLSNHGDLLAREWVR